MCWNQQDRGGKNKFLANKQLTAYPPRRFIAGNKLRLSKFGTETSPSTQSRFMVSTYLLEQSNHKPRMIPAHYSSWNIDTTYQLGPHYVQFYLVKKYVK